MSTDLAQLRTLLRMMIRLDFRTRSPLGGGKRSRSGNALTVAMVFYVIIGSALGVGTDVVQFDPVLRMTLLLAITALYLAFNIIVEYQQILLSPTDGDVLYWRPIASRTLFAARALHIFLYVNLLSAALLLVPSLLVAFSAPGNVLGVWCAFVFAGMGNAMLTTAVAILLYAVLLKHVPTERLQDALVWFQVLMGLLVFLGYQALGPLLEKMLTHPASLEWLRYLPARWFAALPEIVGWEGTIESTAALGSGVLLTFVGVFFAVRRLAPHYQGALQAQDAQATVERAAPVVDAGGLPVVELAKPSSWLRGQALQAAFGRLVTRGSSERAGYHFFLSMLQGDRRLKTTLLPIVVLPVGFLLYGLAQGVFPDPYATVSESTSSSDARRASQALRASYLAVYFITFTAINLSRSLTLSASWRAAWVFYAAPLSRFDRFYRGVLWGAASGLLLPTILLTSVLLLILWRDPSHVLMHMSIPLGLICMALPLSLWLQPAPPFSQEVVRHDRMRGFLSSLVLFLPLTIVAMLHYQLREHGGILLLAGPLLAVVGVFPWWMARHRVHTVLHEQSFDG